MVKKVKIVATRETTTRTVTGNDGRNNGR